MSLTKRLLLEPIVHFLFAGVLLYALAYWIRGPELIPQDESTIVVDRESILNFIQFRANAFDPDNFALTLNAMSEEELDNIINAYVEEEVLFREAQSLSLDSSDYIIRQRMVQKMSFLLSDLASPAAEITEPALSEYFQHNIEAYLISPSATFTHVYFDDTNRGQEQAFADATALIASFNVGDVGFNDVTDEGDRFPYLRNYVDRTLDYVRGHFGIEFSTGLQELSPSATQWQGPLRSAFGYHIVLLPTLKASSYPELNQVRSNVERDYLLERREALLSEMTQSVKKRYQIIMEEIRPDPVQ